MENLALRHASWTSVPPGRIAFYQKRYLEEVEQELQRIRTTLAWKDESPANAKSKVSLLRSRILATHQVEDIILHEESKRHPAAILVLESGRGLFVKKPKKKITHYHQSFSRMKGSLLR